MNDGKDFYEDQIEQLWHDEDTGATCLEGPFGHEWIIGSDEQMQAWCSYEIKRSIWSFRPEYLMNFINEEYKLEPELVEYDNQDLMATLELLVEECEPASPILRAAISENMQDFINSAIRDDGRGHFLSRYNGEERSVKITGDIVYLYKN